MPANEALDAISRGLAQGMSRREALRKGGAAFLGTMALSPADALAKVTGKCPKHRVRCNGKCCPAGEVCLHPKKKKGKHAKTPKPVCGCPTNTTRCKGKCVHTKTDVHNCGRCGHKCGPGQHCSGGKCLCPKGQTECGGKCVTLANDPHNCGRCGTVCAGGTVCSAGKCICTGATTDCAGTCVSTATDPHNCGACGHVCAAGTVCSSGACVSTCPAGTTECNGACVSTATDNANCGTCGTVCAAPLVCQGGTCAPCPSGTTDCGGACINTAADPANCGGCGLACGTNQIYTSGTCASCGGGQIVCGDTCCSTPGCCGSGCQNTHSNGITGSYFDCNAIGTPGNAATYNVSMAQDAAASFSTQGKVVGPCTVNGVTYDVVTTASNDGTTFASWAYDGPFAGHVVTRAGGTQCPIGSDPTWT
jgi:stigma-specific protein Stig1